MSVRVATHKRFMALFSLLGAICATPAWAAHGYAEYGDLKYPAGFSNFGYLNPKAPIGGMLLLGNPDRRTSFDKFNPFTIKGTSAPGLNQLVFESLLITSWDETASGYGLLADD
ncbi:ABC transporter substrate-binding protein, partial [Lactobacillus crispatus]